MNLTINENQKPIDEYPVEIVERKGLGHPDTIADGITESISIEYSKYCLENFGIVLHHNVDKISVLGGLCDLEYGRGKLIKPYRLIINGRMSSCLGNKKIPIKEIQNEAIKKYLNRILPRLDFSKDLQIHNFTCSLSKVPYWFNPRSAEDIPDYKNPHANDTSTLVGFWPLSTVEKSVLSSEKFFYDNKINQRLNFTGSDIKIMALRNGQNLNLTLCVPFQADKTENTKKYFEYKNMIQENLLSFLKKEFGSHFKISVQINTQNQKMEKCSDDGRGRYLTVIGSALDYGEEGVTGRGNRSRGLISSFRPSTVESIYGKNPVYHVGKICSHIANTLAEKIGISLGCSTTVIISTKIGDPLYSPDHILVETSKKADKDFIQKIIKEQLNRRDWTEEIVTKGVFLPENDLFYV
jgi:S-adenosylmethionine synthetase